MNSKGFTLVELIATIVLLTLVMSIAAISITSIVKKTKEENYNLLINNIKSAGEVYYQECRYANNSGIVCNKNNNDYIVSLGSLVTYGYLTGNSTNDNDIKTVVNPKDDINISDCEIKVTYSNGNIIITAITTGNSCPTEY